MFHSFCLHLLLHISYNIQPPLPSAILPDSHSQNSRLFPLKSTVFLNNMPGTVESLLVSVILRCIWVTFPGSYLQLLCLETYLLAEGWVDTSVTAGTSALRKYCELAPLLLWLLVPAVRLPSGVEGHIVTWLSSLKVATYRVSSCFIFSHSGEKL